MSNPYYIAGNAGAAFATVTWSGTASGSTVADGDGNYSILNLASGSYTVTPTLTSYTLSPTDRVVVITTAGVVGVNFTSTDSNDAYSVPDCRNYGDFPNKPVDVRGTQTYVQPVDSRAAGALVDSRTAGRPVDCRVNVPVNSRTPGTYGPGE